MWIYDRPIAHRGLHNKNGITENSMASFQAAIEKNYFVEIDVRLLADGEVAVFHDGTLKRLCGEDIKTSQITSEDLKNEKYFLPNGEKIPLLKEMLELTTGKTKILLEIKWDSLTNHKLEKAVYEVIKGHENDIAIQAFRPTTIKWFRKNAPEFLCGTLSSYTQSSFGKVAIKLFNFFGLRISKPDFLAFDILNAHDKGLAKFVEKNKYGLICWTVKSEEQLKKAREYNVDNIIFELVEPDNYYPR